MDRVAVAKLEQEGRAAFLEGAYPIPAPPAFVVGLPPLDALAVEYVLNWLAREWVGLPANALQPLRDQEHG